MSNCCVMSKHLLIHSAGVRIGHPQAKKKEKKKSQACICCLITYQLILFGSVTVRKFSYSSPLCNVQDIRIRWVRSVERTVYGGA